MPAVRSSPCMQRHRRAVSRAPALASAPAREAGVEAVWRPAAMQRRGTTELEPEDEGACNERTSSAAMHTHNTHIHTRVDQDGGAHPSGDLVSSCVPPPFREYALACRCVSQSQPRRQGVYVEITHWAFSVVGGGWCAHTGMSRCRSLEQGESREGGGDDLGDDVLA